MDDTLDLDGEWPAPPQPAAPPLSLPERYAHPTPLGVGGMGEVYRVHDQQLDRPVALKLIRPDRLAVSGISEDFRVEARVSAGLQHPGIVPVYDSGVLADGRMFYTMKVFTGQTLGESMAQPASLRAVIGALQRASEAVAYAHSRGVIHRDLKPSNIMLGEFGEVAVLDWGLAVRVGVRPARVAGTPGWLAPEQATPAPLTPAADVWALGCILHACLDGSSPFEATTFATSLSRLKHSWTPPEAPPASHAELWALVTDSLRAEPAERLPDAGVFARRLQEWLDGARRREQALAQVAQAAQHHDAIAALRAEAAEHRARSQAHLDALDPWAPESDKLAGWRDSARADALDQEADITEVTALRTLQSALSLVPGLPEAHERLADHYHQQHRDAEARGDHSGARRLEVMLRAHDQGRYADYLRGDGALTLVTDPPGATATLLQHEPRHHRLQLTPRGVLGVTPLDRIALPRGSFIVRLAHPDRPTVDYPVRIDRGEHWDGVPPGGQAPAPVVLPEKTPEECAVPAGWFISGGDLPMLDNPLPRRRVWLDGFVVRRFPVTNREYLAYLNDLLDRGEEDEALRRAPQHPARTAGTPGAQIYTRDPDGHFQLAEDDSGHAWLPDYPVLMVDWHCAMAYADWLADREGLPWRLLGELEWEKAARGVDGRHYPWGSHFDPTWCRMRRSAPGFVLPVVVDSYPVDVSPYGVRGMAGNVGDWCLEPYPAGTPVQPDGRAEVLPQDTSVKGNRGTRGGNWTNGAFWCRADIRKMLHSRTRRFDVGIRLARSW